MIFTYEIYDFLESVSAYLVLWIFLFTILNILRILFHKCRGVEKIGHNSAIVELAGLPLVLLQSVCFVRAVGVGDILSALLFLWWGPGFFMTVLYIVYCKSRKQKPNWFPAKQVISWLCKVNYVLFMVVFFLLDKPGMMLVYSLWVINDQFGLAYLSLDADRLRRTFHDYWFFRVLYPVGLFIPFFYVNTPFRLFSIFYGTTIFVLWISGILYVRRKSRLWQLPDDPTLLRNMVYFSRDYSSVTAPPASRKI